MVTEKKARRRPAPKRERQGEYVGFRSPVVLKEKLEAAARSSNRSLSSEAQFRLERSFEHERVLHEALALAYGPRTAALVLLIARAMHDAGTAEAFNKTFTPEGAANWTDDPDAYEQATKAADTILTSARPPGEPTKASTFKRLPADHPLHNASMGEGFANTLIDAVSGRGSTGELQKWAEPLRAMLGSVVERMSQDKHQYAVLMDVVLPQP